MGLFDKMRNAASNVKNSMSADSTTVSVYVDTIYSILGPSCLTRDHIKKYLEVKLNTQCDETALDVALLKFVKAEVGDTYWYNVYSGYVGKAGGYSQAVQEEVLNICFKELMEETKIKFDDVLKKVENHPSDFFVEENISIFKKQFNGSRNCHIMYRAIDRAIGERFVELVYDNNKTAITAGVQILLAHLLSFKGLSRVYALALRAMNFRNSLNNSYGANYNDYKGITAEDCKKAVLNSQVFLSDIESKNPFDKESTLIQHIKNLLNVKMYYDYCNTGWQMTAFNNCYFTEAICYYALSQMSSVYKNVDLFGDDVEKFVSVIASYIDYANEYLEKTNTVFPPGEIDFTIKAYNIVSDEVLEQLSELDLTEED